MYEEERRFVPIKSFFFFKRYLFVPIALFVVLGTRRFVVLGTRRFVVLGTRRFVVLGTRRFVPTPLLFFFELSCFTPFGILALFVPTPVFFLLLTFLAFFVPTPFVPKKLLLVVFVVFLEQVVFLVFFSSNESPFRVFVLFVSTPFVPMLLVFLLLEPVLALFVVRRFVPTPFVPKKLLLVVFVFLELCFTPFGSFAFSVPTPLLVAFLLLELCFTPLLLELLELEEGVFAFVPKKLLLVVFVFVFLEPPSNKFEENLSK